MAQDPTLPGAPGGTTIFECPAARVNCRNEALSRDSDSVRVKWPATLSLSPSQLPSGRRSTWMSPTLPRRLPPVVGRGAGSAFFRAGQIARRSLMRRRATLNRAQLAVIRGFRRPLSGRLAAAACSTGPAAPSCRIERGPLAGATARCARFVLQRRTMGGRAPAIRGAVTATAADDSALAAWRTESLASDRWRASPY
jgi:hypothetical protein